MTEFWRRWHISLGSWFRDYLYIPLGGSRVSKPRLVFNMFLVWSLTGLWHGAAWTFFLWGVSFFALLVLERFTGLGKWMDKHAVGHLYLCLAITTVSVIIRSVDVGSAVRFIGAMYGAGANGLWDQTTLLYLREYGWFLLAAVIFAIPFGPFLEKRLHVPQAASQIARGAGLSAIFVLSISYIVMGGYNPFIYFNF